MPKEKVTITSIANDMGLSPLTVSRALNGQPGVGKELKGKIIDRAKELGYKKIKSIYKSKILLISEGIYSNYNVNYNLNIMVTGIDKYVRQNNGELTVEYIDQNMNDNLKPPHSLSKNNDFDGVILLGWYSEDYFSMILRKAGKLVTFNGYNYGLKCDYVGFDTGNLGYTAAQYLIQKGHKKIGIINVKGIYGPPRRFLGFKKAFENNNLTLDEKYVISLKSDMRNCVKKMIKEKDLPTAFLCNSDDTAFDLLKYLLDHDISVPDDVSIIGVGNSQLSAMSSPNMTTFDQNIDYSCKMAVKVLFERINNNNDPYRSIEIRTKLIERKSVRDITKM